MTRSARSSSGRPFLPWRVIGWGGVVAVLMLPLVLRAPWTLADYVIAGGVLGAAGLVVELLVRASGDLAYRAAGIGAIGTAVLLFWVNGAVGFLGDEGNPANLMFAGVVAVAVIGAVVASFRARGMAVTMFATAAAQVLVGMIGLAGGMASPGEDGLYEVVMGTTLFGALWLICGGLFRRASQARPV